MISFDWIKELIDQENKIQETGVIDNNAQYIEQRRVVQFTLDFLSELKIKFTDVVNIYNELKSSPLGRIKIYTIAQAHGDFMLFRNGYKMIFSLKSPGEIVIRFNFIGNQLMSTVGILESQMNTKVKDDQSIKVKLKPFDQLVWTFKDQEFDVNYLVRHYLILFARESWN